jgi:tRNA(Ile)-lysidine synthase
LRKPEPGFSAAALAEILFGAWRLPPAAALKLAYSGGLDSTVLLQALAVLRAEHSFALSAIHIDHGLQPAAAAWSERCARRCAALGVPFETRRVQVSVGEEGLEAAARRARYAALAAALAPGEFLLTAHQRDDQAETLLLQLLRGAGLAGLAAMPARAAFGGGELLRPLLAFGRADLQAWARAQGLEWVEDPSNRDTRLRRNYLRAEILPRLAPYWPEAPTLLARSAAHAAEAQALLDELAQADLAACHAPDARPPLALSVAACQRLSAPRQRNLLRHWLRRQALPVPGTRQLEELRAQLQATPRSQHACVRWPGVEAWRYRDRLVALPLLAAPDPALDVAWDLRAPIELPGVGRVHADPVRGQGLARARLPEVLHIRLRHGGETLQLPGRRHHHVLKKRLQGAWVPPWVRARLPLFYVDAELAAVGDLWVCAPYAARAGEEALAIVWEPLAGSVHEPEKIR